MRRDPPRSDPVANQTCQGQERNVSAVRHHSGSSSGSTTASNTRGGEQHVLHGLLAGVARIVVSFAWCVICMLCCLHDVSFLALSATCCMVCYLHGVAFARCDCSIWTQDRQLHGRTLLE